MLRQTFIHLPGVGPAVERALWRQGCDTWETYLAYPGEFRGEGFGRDSLREGLLRSEVALDAGEHQFFSHGLGLRESWRAWPEFRDRCVYLDIETDGGRSGDSVTMVGLYDGEFQALIKGDGLHAFPDVISNYGMIVTFFGSGFDIPVLQNKFPHVPFDHLHLDLCPTFRRLGVGGGLKKIEKLFEIAREDETDGLTGWDAVKLWRRWKTFHDSDALRTLVAYNREDVVNLEILAGILYERMVAATLPNAAIA